VTSLKVTADWSIDMQSLVSAPSLSSVWTSSVSARLRCFEIMLARMFDTSDDGHSDRLLSFLKPVSGWFSFAQAIAMLAEIG
jgi:hypothetical protein